MFDYRNLFNLSGKTALVVGSGSGIGEAASLALAAHGATVHCADIKAEAAADTRDQIRAAGGQAESLTLDMRDSAAVANAISGITKLDILISTPSINVRKPLLQMSEAEFESVMNLNLKGTFLQIKAAGQKMAAGGGGSIIVFSSIRSQVVEPGQGVYAATKAGAVQMVRALAAELAPQGVRVNAIAPGVVETPLTAQIKNHPDWYQAYADRNALKRWAQPHEMAGAVLLLASDAGSYMTGSLLFVDGGWTAVDGRFAPPL
ncbi:MAG: SDR family oxidoreductase [Anaerolineales bacterium]|nr:SDR family oxidoreductase [Anaerolineales bacterium]